MFVMEWVFDGGQELEVTGYAADVVRWCRALAGDAQRIGPLCLRFGDRLHLDAMAPAITKVIFVDKLAHRFAKRLLKRIFLLVERVLPVTMLDAGGLSL
jgi:hypothetical protein